MFRPITLFVMLSCLLAACSGLRTYRSDQEKNLFITTKTETRGWLSSVNTALDIYRMSNGCDIDYLGTVNLDDSPVEVGVPAGVPAYLVFRFESSAFLSNTQSSMGYDVALYPEYGQVYDVNVTYRDNIYNVEVQERARGADEGELLAIDMVQRDCSSET